jgi:hypothetical protein
MVSHLGYQASDTNVPVDETGDRARAVDVRGETYAIAWRRLRIVSFAVFAIAVVSRTVVPIPDGDVPVVPNVLLYVAIVAYAAAYLGRLRTRQFTWVKCKDLERPVSREDVRALNDAVKKTEASAAAKWKPARVLLVAGANGFEGDAVAFAQSVGVECYRRTELGFERAP